MGWGVIKKIKLGIIYRFFKLRVYGGILKRGRILCKFISYC